MIQFRKLTMQSFMSYKDKQTIQLANQGIVRIEGVNEDDQTADSNMAGKSTIVEALLWCLFGRTLRGLKHNQVVNRKSKKNCFVAVTFISEGKLYLCRRNRKHTKYSNRLVLYRKNTPLSFRHESDTQRRLEDILGCDYESFVNSVVFGGFDSGSRKQFALQTDAQQKHVLDSFLKFEKFEIALRRTKKALEKENDQSSKMELDIVRLDTRVHALRERVRDLRRRCTLLDKTQSDERRAIKKTIRKLEKSSLKRNEENLKQAEDQVEKYIERKAGAGEKLSRIQRQLSDIAKKHSDREKLLGKNCPTCGSLVNGNSISALLNHLRRERSRAIASLKVAQETVGRLDRRLTYGRRRLKRLQEKQKQHENTLSKIMTLKERLRSQAESSPFQEELDEASKQYSRQVSRLLAYKYEEQLLKNRIKDLQFWETGFGNRGVKALIVREALPAMNAKLREYSQILFEGNATIEFKASKETQRGDERELFNLSYVTQRNADSYLAESSGGRRRVDICVLLVFHWLSRTSDLLLVDEILDGLDESGRERVLSVLSRHVGTTIVISHRKDVNFKIGSVWKVTKKNGESRIETQNV